ncbi:hypothetical protein AMTR_s00003p00097270 [Amborella trichopoda]|uniref:Uncharacterized protein n=1 Tax=Amborella trichopoda TaxID=13333 RepID=W1P829_AMBTC|nr:hypothetical protein AMTR_s00003p00097270 [Amborella trichopoda]
MDLETWIDRREMSARLGEKGESVGVRVCVGAKHERENGEGWCRRRGIGVGFNESVEGESVGVGEVGEERESIAKIGTQREREKLEELGGCKGVEEERVVSEHLGVELEEVGHGDGSERVEEAEASWVVR